jgi:hypothetical protein
MKRGHQAKQVGDRPGPAAAAIAQAAGVRSLGALVYGLICAQGMGMPVVVGTASDIADENDIVEPELVEEVEI